jgi:hypothetical protein
LVVPSSCNVEHVGEKDHVKLVSITDVFSPNGRTTSEVTWDLSVRKIDGNSCEYTNHVTARATEPFLAFIEEHGISFQEAAAARSLHKSRLARFRDLHLVDTRMRGATPASRAKRLDGVRRPGEESFDIAVQTVSHPAPDTSRRGLYLRPGAIADALDPAADRHTNDPLSAVHDHV